MKVLVQYCIFRHNMAVREQGCGSEDLELMIRGSVFGWIHLFLLHPDPT